MDLDTKLSNIKSNVFLKILTIIITILLCCIFTTNAFSIVKVFYTFEEEALNKNATVYDTRAVRLQLSNDTDYLINSAISDMARKENEEIKKDFINQGIREFLSAQNYYYKYENAIISYYNDDYYDSEYYDEEMGEFSIKPENHSIYYDEGNDEIYYSGSVNIHEPLRSKDNNSDLTFMIPIIASEKEARKKLNQEYISESYNYYDSGIFRNNYDEELSGSSLKYYVKATDGKIVSNVNDINALKQKMTVENSLSIKNGAYNESKLVNAINRYSDNYYTEYIDEAYFVIDFDEDSKDEYITALNVYNEVSPLHRNGIEKQIIICAVCLVLMLILLAVAAAFAGHSSTGVRTLIIDKVPNDLHLVINGAIIVIIAVVLINNLDYYRMLKLYDDYTSTLYESYANSSLFMPSLMAGANIMWLLLVELVTSYARQIKTKSGFLKNTVIYFVLHISYRIASWFGKNVIINPIKNLRKAAAYKPEVFKKQFILYIAVYSLINFILLLSEMFWCAVHSAFMMLITAFFWTILNAALIVFIAKYVIHLDKIISSIKNNTIPNVNYHGLPNSLKILYDSQLSTHNQLSKAVDDAVKNERMRIELITNVSHDLKTPLTSIINYVDLLKKCDITDETAKEYISVLDEKGAKLKRLIEDLIEASKATSGVLTLNPVHLDLSELATQAVVEHQQEFIDNGLELIFKGDKQSHMAYADGQKTFRIIENLLSNAKKYSARGSRVYADVYEQNGISVFEIKNVSAAQLDITTEELKKRFVRGDKSRNQEGNGLGLSIADNLCIAMRGRMEISIDGDLFKVKVLLPKNK